MRTHAAARTRRAAGVAALLAVYAVAALTSVRRESPTFDEPQHLAAGLSYWLARDYRLNPQAGLLPQMWAALPLRLGSAAFPSFDRASWRQSDEWRAGAELLTGTGRDADVLLARARTMIVLAGVGLGWLVWAWSRRLWGPRGGWISLALYAFSPAMLAHGRLVTSDLAAAAGFTAATWALWTLLHRVRATTVLVAGVATAALALSKMSAPIFAPVAAVLVALRLIGGRPLVVVTTTARRIRGARRQAPWLLGAFAAHALLAAAAVWGAYGFRWSMLAEPVSADARPRIAWPALIEQAGLAGRVLEIARDRRWLPEAYLYGAAHAAALVQSGQSAFLDGEHRRHGFWLFFPRCLLLKTPIPLFALLALALCASRGAFRRAAPLWALVAVYLALSIAAPLNIGHRHLLPIYPALFVIAGAASAWLGRRTRAAAIVVGLLLCSYAVESLRTWPHYLAYFNAIGGGPALGYRHLVDSSLDWGQDLPALERWLERSAAGEPVYLAYFGATRPADYGIDAVALPSVTPLGPLSDERAATTALRAGVYCISATLLQSVYGPVTGPWTASKEQTYRALRDAPARATDARTARLFEGLRFAKLCDFLRAREPDASAGHSILIYRLTEADLRRALEDGA